MHPRTAAFLEALDAAVGAANAFSEAAPDAWRRYGGLSSGAPTGPLMSAYLDSGTGLPEALTHTNWGIPANLPQRGFRITDGAKLLAYDAYAPAAQSKHARMAVLSKMAITRAAANAAASDAAGAMLGLPALSVGFRLCIQLMPKRKAGGEPRVRAFAQGIPLLFAEDGEQHSGLLWHKTRQRVAAFLERVAPLDRRPTALWAVGPAQMAAALPPAEDGDEAFFAAASAGIYHSNHHAVMIPAASAEDAVVIANAMDAVRNCTIGIAPKQDRQNAAPRAVALFRAQPTPPSPDPAAWGG